MKPPSSPYLRKILIIDLLCKSPSYCPDASRKPGSISEITRCFPDRQRPSLDDFRTHGENRAFGRPLQRDVPRVRRSLTRHVFEMGRSGAGVLLRATVDYMLGGAWKNSTNQDSGPRRAWKSPMGLRIVRGVWAVVQSPRVGNVPW